MKKTEEPDFDEIQQQVQRVQRIKVGITIAALVLMVILTIVFWDASDGYVIELEADKSAGYEWIYTFDEEGVIEEVSNSYEDGIFSFTFKSVEKGKVKIHFVCIKNGDRDNPEEEATYSVRVDKALNIINKVIYNE